MRRRQRVDAAGQAARDEHEYRIVLVRYGLRVAVDPLGVPAEQRRLDERIEAATVAELRELAVELDCAPALKALDHADELLAEAAP
jgi:hypothetical protein